MNIYIQRANRKNNIVIFGIQSDKDHLLKTNLVRLNVIFESSLTEKDINNIYLNRTKITIVVEYISFLKRQNIFKQLKLKGTGVSIIHDLRIEDQKNNKILERSQSQNSKSI